MSKPTIKPEMLEFDTDNRDAIKDAQDLIARYRNDLDPGEFTELRRAVVPIQREMGQTFEQIGMIWGVTRERIRQICRQEEEKAKARRHYKALLKSLGIEPGENAV